MGARRTFVAALGDAITAGSPCWDPDREVRMTIGASLDERHQWPYWAALELGLRVAVGEVLPWHNGAGCGGSADRGDSTR